ncbi:MAG: DNA starvation/stationary phase protection protein [Parvibaculum sp.]|jgi:starvation-inducible DNA-binding protein|uniref:Dps family protein n=1 Tax=Parvibaculum sp. TaxID=2024848 RepID=UPI000C45FFBB|nr:DNA starvation/stationary phase protection protein [Parvibaculum sp.]|tara:strand:+ start:1618 stop:2127 length:510 start_codon:yes stop_codon:yes gene_type:complete
MNYVYLEHEPRRCDVKVDTGIAANDRNDIAEGLSRVLADTYTLYLKTHQYHWNVTGPQFRSLHLMFEEQYRELWAATDEIAERIRALGEFAPGTYAEFTKLSSIQEDNTVPSSDQMVKNLVKGHEQVVKTARDLFKVADEAGDEVTADLMVQRMQASEKTAWMLRSTVE